MIFVLQLGIMYEISIFTFDNTILRFTRIQQRKERKETMEEKKFWVGKVPVVCSSSSSSIYLSFSFLSPLNWKIAQSSYTQNLVRNYHYYNPSSFLFLFLLQILQKLRLSKIGTKEMVRTLKSSSFAWFMPNQKER